MSQEFGPTFFLMKSHPGGNRTRSCTFAEYRASTTLQGESRAYLSSSLIRDSSYGWQGVDPCVSRRAAGHSPLNYTPEASLLNWLRNRIRHSF